MCGRFQGWRGYHQGIHKDVDCGKDLEKGGIARGGTVEKTGRVWIAVLRVASYPHRPHRFHRDVHARCGWRAGLSTEYPGVSAGYPPRCPHENSGEWMSGLCASYPHVDEVIHRVIHRHAGDVERRDGRRMVSGGAESYPQRRPLVHTIWLFIHV